MNQNLHFNKLSGLTLQLQVREAMGLRVPCALHSVSKHSENNKAKHFFFFLMKDVSTSHGTLVSDKDILLEIEGGGSGRRRILLSTILMNRNRGGNLLEFPDAISEVN